MNGFIPQAPIDEPAPLYDDRPAHEREIEKLDAMIGDLRARVADLESQLALEREQHAAELAAIADGVESVARVALRRSECRLYDCAVCCDCVGVDHG